MVFGKDFDKSNGANEVPEHPEGGKYGYRLHHTAGDYTIPNRVLNTNDDRKVRVITIGAGVSGILMAYLIQRDNTNVDHVIYEKNGDIGGTWLENLYPGCACDVPSHAYTYAFALNADWPQCLLSSSDDIFRYLSRVVECFELRMFVQFDSAIQACEWDESEGKWHITVRNLLSGGVSTDTCDILIGANGLLNSWKYPEEAEGLHDFKGRLIHTARWPQDYTQEQWKNDRIVVVGSGASALQVVPTLRKDVPQMDVFIRTSIWFAEIAVHSGENSDYDPALRQKLREDTDALLETAKSIENGLNGLAGIKSTMIGSAESRMARKVFTANMREVNKDDAIIEHLLPSFPVGCRRVTPGDPFMRAVQGKNVTLHKGAVNKVGGNRVIGSSGDVVEADTLICATGFDVSYVPKYSMRGRNGVVLKNKWAKVPEGYIGLAVPDMPNYFVFQGPTFPISNGSVMGPLQAVGAYIIQMVQKMQRELIHSFTSRQDITDEFNRHAQTWVNGSCWADRSCRSWYKNLENGRVNAVGPGSSLHYCEMVETPRYEDFDIRYTERANRFAFMGLGFTRNQVEEKVVRCWRRSSTPLNPMRRRTR